MSKTLKPQIRFKGYDGEWQQAKVREVFILGNGYTPSKAVAAYWTNGTIPWFRMEDIRENGRVLADAIQHVTPSAVKSSGLFPAGSIIVSTTATIGEHALIIADSLANQQFTVFSNRKSLELAKANYLLYRFYGLGDWCRRNVNAGGLAAVNISDLQKYDIDYPKEETERDSIAEYFSNLDTQIKEAEREVDRLEKMKIASLQKMFPRPGATTPEIRFAGFSEPWKTMTFKDVYSSLKNNTLSRDCLNYNGGIAKNIHYGDVLIKFGAYVNPLSVDVPFVNFNVGIELSSAYKLADGDVIFADTAEDEAVGKCTEIRGVNDSNVLSGLHTIAVRPNFKFAPFYLGYYHNSNAYHSQLLPLMQGVKVLSINRTAISETMVAFPSSLDEQRAIGEYFRNLDELIAAKRKSIVKLRNIKKACLSKMFVNDTNL